MKNVEPRKFIIIVLSTVISFCIILGIFLAYFLNRPERQVESNQNNPSYTAGQSSDMHPHPEDSSSLTAGHLLNQTGVPTPSNIVGEVDVRSINAVLSAQKYTLMNDGVLNWEKVAEFVDNNINLFVPGSCTIVSHCMDDLNNDGTRELGIMYEKADQDNRYLMISALRYEDSKFIKDIDTVLRQDGYSIQSSEVVAGDIITGGNKEFSFIQRDPGGSRASRLKVMVLVGRGFSEFYTQDAGPELEVKDFDDDGRMELYTSSISENVMYKSWHKWNGKQFVEYYSEKISPDEEIRTW